MSFWRCLRPSLPLLLAWCHCLWERRDEDVSRWPDPLPLTTLDHEDASEDDVEKEDDDAEEEAEDHRPPLRRWPCSRGLGRGAGDDGGGGEGEDGGEGGAVTALAGAGSPRARDHARSTSRRCMGPQRVSWCTWHGRSTMWPGCAHTEQSRQRPSASSQYWRPGRQKAEAARGASARASSAPASASRSAGGPRAQART